MHTALIMMSPNVTSEPKVMFRKGESSLKMNLVPSVASTVPTKPIEEIKKDIHEVEEEEIDTSGPPKKLDIPPKKQVKVAEKIVQKIEQKIQKITSTAEYIKIQKEVDFKQPQKQESKVATLDSKEIIADVKVKGVATGAMVKNVFKPSYPSSCKRQGHEGTTVLEVTILSKGKCGNIDILKSAGCESLDKAAIKALKRAKYISC